MIDVAISTMYHTQLSSLRVASSRSLSSLRVASSRPLVLSSRSLVLRISSRIDFRISTVRSEPSMIEIVAPDQGRHNLLSPRGRK
jgi:hypothetical protein